MRYLLVFVLVSSTLFSVNGQFLPVNNSHSVKDNLMSGIYLSFEDFKNNEIILPADIKSDLDPLSRDYYFLLFKETVIQVVKEGKLMEIKPSEVWGYTDGSELYLHEANFANVAEITQINGEHPFARVNRLGTLSLVHYLNNGKKHNDPITRTLPTKNKQPVEFIFDTRDGKIYQANLYNLKRLIEKDKELITEYSNYSGDSSIKFYVFFEKFNRHNPFALKEKITLN